MKNDNVKPIVGKNKKISNLSKFKDKLSNLKRKLVKGLKIDTIPIWDKIDHSLVSII